MKLDEHNARVRALAGRMPADMLSRAVCAIGHRANAGTGVTSGFSVATIASESRKHLGGAYGISARQLKRAIPILEAAGVMRVTHSPALAGKRQPNVYHLDYGYTDVARLTEAYETGRRQRRSEREARQEWLEEAVDRRMAELAAEGTCPAFDGPCEPDPWSVTDGKPVCIRCGQQLPRLPAFGHKVLGTR